MSKKSRKELTSEELYAFSDEMGMMITSGVSAIQGLAMMIDESEGGEEKEGWGTGWGTLGPGQQEQRASPSRCWGCQPSARG